MKQVDELTQDEIHKLGTYNSERARGLVHTPEWRQEMARLQERFDGYANNSGS